ncbi:hypothetical protein WJX84_008784 [Apatococcus fuscideae]|uniref:Uncharacterized protein n=1 Tax=Apatococcus fuscideae TaxID=2026836 RepID=A0AAW1TK24_9CHLO
MHKHEELPHLGSSLEPSTFVSMQQIEPNPAQNLLSPQTLTEASLSADIQLLQSLAAKVQPWQTLEVSGPQGSVRPFSLVQDPSAWLASDFKVNPEVFIHRLSDAEVSELKAAVAAVLQQGVQQQGNLLLLLHAKLVTETDFPLPKLGPKLKAMRENLRSGRGFQLIRGIPVEQWSNRESVIAYYGMGLYLGKANPPEQERASCWAHQGYWA